MERFGQRKDRGESKKNGGPSGPPNRIPVAEGEGDGVTARRRPIFAWLQPARAPIRRGYRSPTCGLEYREEAIGADGSALPLLKKLLQGKIVEHLAGESSGLDSCLGEAHGGPLSEREVAAFLYTWIQFWLSRRWIRLDTHRHKIYVHQYVSKIKVLNEDPLCLSR
jgi:hypothetical protein